MARRGYREIPSEVWNKIEVRTQERTVVDKFYICPGCKAEYSHKHDALNCFLGHKQKEVFRARIGDEIEFDNGSYGTDHGSMHQSWWPNYEWAMIIEVNKGSFLVELDNKTRKHVRFTNVKDVRFTSVVSKGDA